MNFIKILILTLVGYLIGTISPSYILAKIKGINIKEKGSKNCGASNVFISVGKKHGIIVGAIDIFKVFLAVLICYPFFKDYPNYRYIVGFSCVLGHIFPFYLKFKGGKGFACLISCAFLTLNPFVAFGTLLVAFGLTAISNYIILGTYTFIISVSIFVPLLTDFDIVVCIYCYLACGIIAVKHIKNIINIIKGTEFKVYKKKNKTINDKNDNTKINENVKIDNDKNEIGNDKDINTDESQNEN